MATFTTDLQDSSGTPVEFGDTIQVVLPEMEFDFPHLSGMSDYICRRLVEGVVTFRLSQGLVLKITKIIEAEDDNHNTKPGQVIPLRRTVWEWRKV